MKEKEDFEGPKEEQEDDNVHHGKGTDLVITVFNKETKETITLDAGDNGEQYILTMAKLKSNHLFMAKSCDTKFLIDHLVHIAQDNKQEYVVAFMMAMTMGIISKKLFQNVKVSKMEIGLDEDGLPDIPGLGPDKPGKPPTFN